MLLLKKISPSLLLFLILAFVIWQATPPQSLITATPLQLLALFGPLLGLLFSLINLYYHFWQKSLVLSLGLIILLILQGLSYLNLLSFGIIIIGILLLARTFNKHHKLRPPTQAIPKLSKLSRLKSFDKEPH